jgi:putative DNA primase/helicase
MTSNRQNPLSAIFYGHTVRLRPETPSSTEYPLPTPNDPDTAMVADVPNPNEAPNADAPQDAPAPALPAEPTAVADLVYLCDLQPRPIEWLWQDRLACGTLAMLSGVAGSGKTWIALAIAAALSRGRAPYTGETLNPCTVLYASIEHNGSEIILPRFVGLNGDPKRFAVLRGNLSAPSPSLNVRDTSTLEDALQRTQARLLILDSLDIDSKETLPLLQKLARLAEKHHCCILLIRHLSKRGPGRPALRGQGSAEISAAISAALRTEFLAGSSPDAPSQPALLQIKSNLGPLAIPLAYRIGAAGKFTWTGLSKLTGEEILADRPTGAGLPKRRFAGEWLRAYLQNGSQTQGTIEIAAQRDGVCLGTLRRARFDLGVHSAKDGMKGVWYWSLPVEIERRPPAKEAEHSN